MKEVQAPDESVTPPPRKSLKDHVSSPVKTISRILNRIISPVKLFTSNLRNPSSEDPAELNILLEPFFTNKWIAKKGGKKGEGKLSNNFEYFSKLHLNFALFCRSLADSPNRPTVPVLLSF